MRSLRAVLALSALLLAAGSVSAQEGGGPGFKKLADLSSGVWSMGFVRFAGEGEATLVVGGMDGRVYKVRNGRVMALADVFGPPLRVVGADLDGDGREEILVASASYPSQLYALGGDGRLIWRAEAEGCYVDVAVGEAGGEMVIAAVDFFGGVDLYNASGEKIRTIRKLSGANGEQPIAQPTAIALGDLDGDGDDEIVTSHYRGWVTAFRPNGELLWRTPSNDKSEGWERFGVAVPEPVRINGKEYEIELQRGGNFARNLRVADLDGDGRPEVVVGFFRSQLMALTSEGKLLWNKILNYDVVDHMIGYVHMDQRGVFKDSVAKSHPIFEIARRPEGGSWIVALQPREDILETSTHFGATDIFLIDAAGEILRRDIRDATWFRLALDPARPDALWLANRTVHSSLWETKLSRLAKGLPEQGVNDVTPPVRNWVELAGELADKEPLEATPQAPERKTSIVVLYDHASFDMHFFGFETLKHNLLEMNRFFNGRGLERVEYIFRVNLQEIPHGRTDTRIGLVTQAQAFELAEFVERNRIPVILWLSHGTALTLKAETMIGFSERAPTAFRGVMQVESGGLLTPAYRSFLDVVEKILPHFAKRGQKLFMHTTGAFWSQATSVDPEGLGGLLRRHGKLLVPFVKTNNSQSGEQEVGAVLALWKGGYIEEWGYTSIDHWTFTNIFRMNAFKTASHMGTVDVAALALGARYILYYPPILRADRDDEGRITKIAELEPQLSHMRAIERLVETRILEPLAREQARSLAPVLFAIRRLKERIQGGPEPGILAKTIHFQENAPVNASYIFYGPGLGSSKMAPTAPYGIYAMAPDYLDVARIDGVEKVFSSDLFSIFEDGKPLGVEASAKLLKEEIRLSPMVFHAAGAFTAIQAYAEGRYRVWLVDPGHIAQRGARTELIYEGAGKLARVTDRVSGEALAATGNRVRVVVKPGLFRVLDVEVAP